MLCWGRDGRGMRGEERGAFYRRNERDDDSLSRESRGKIELRGASLEKRGMKLVMRFR
jgi:hypothetical protein